MASEKRKDILGILLIAFGVFIFLSITSYDPREIPVGLGIGYSKNYMGPAGLHIAHNLVKNFIGYFAIVIPVLVIFSGFYQFAEKLLKKFPRWAKFTLLYALYAAIIAGMLTQNNPDAADLYAGKVGSSIAPLIKRLNQFLVRPTGPMADKIDAVGHLDLWYENEHRHGGQSLERNVIAAGLGAPNPRFHEAAPLAAAGPHAVGNQ